MPQSYGVRNPADSLWAATTTFDFSPLNDVSSYEDERKKLYGIIPEDWIPDFYKEGYNNSIEGMAYQMISGKQFFDIDPTKNPGMVNDIMATISSFITPTDILSMATGGGIAAKILGKYGSKTMQIAMKQTNLPKSVIKKAVEAGTMDAVSHATKAKLRATVGAGGFGFYSGLQNAELQVLQDRDMGHIKDLGDATQAFASGFGKGAVHGAAIGAVTGGLGQLGRMAGSKATTRLSERVQSAAAIGGDKGIEIAAFGTIPTIEDALRGEYRLPRAEEWIHAAGVVGGLGVARGAIKVRRDIKDRYSKEAMEAIPEKDVLAAKEKGAGKFYDERNRLDTTDQIWIDKHGNKVSVSTQDFSDTPVDFRIVPGGKKAPKKAYTDLGGVQEVKNEVTYTFRKAGEKEGTRAKPREIQKQYKMTKREFLEQFTRETDPLFKGKTAKESLQIEAERIQKEIGVDKNTHKADLKKLGIDTEHGPKNPQEARSLYEHYKRKKFIDDYVKDKSLDTPYRRHLADIHRDGILKERLPEPIYNALVGFRQVKHRLKHPFSEYSKDKMLKADFESHFELSEVLKDLRGAGIGSNKWYQKGPTPEQYKNLYEVMTSDKYNGGRGITIDGNGKLRKANPDGTFGEFIDIDVGGVNPARLRKIFDMIHARAKKAGIPVQEKLENYLPKLYKTEILDIIRKDVEAIINNNRNYKNDLFSLNPENPVEVERMIRKHLGIDKKGEKIEGAGIASPETVEAFQHLIKQFKDSPYKVMQAWNKLKTEGWSQRYDIAYNLEKSRLLDLPDHFVEKNVGKLVSRYASQYAKRKAFVENFGVRGEKIRAAHEMLREQNRHGEADILEKAYSAFTGNIETDPRFNYAPYWKNAWNNMTQFQVATKIGMGFGAVVNITQPFISTAVALGYGPMINGMRKFKTNKAYKKSIEDRIGYNNMDILKQIFGGEYADIGMFGKFANATTTYLGFKGINKWNYNSAAATMYEYILKQQRIAKGEGVYGKVGQLREIAKRKLKSHGLSEKDSFNLEKASPEIQKKLSKAMYEFARDSQLQKNILNDPMFFNDPRFRPFVLFKRFGYKQATWIGETLKKEWVDYKNPLPVLRLVAGGFAGGLFMNSAKQLITDTLAGEDVYNENYSIPFSFQGDEEIGAGMKRFAKEVTVGEILDTVSAAGGFGLVGDIIASEDRLRAFEFVGKPAMYSDLEKIYDTTINFWKDSGEFGIDAAIRRAPKRASRVLGAFPSRIATRFQTDQQKESYLTFRRGVLKSRILDALIAKNKRKAMQVLEEWNRAYPEKRFTYEDISIDAVIKRYKKKLERKRKIQLDLPPS